jgi:hypothetical protein
MVRCAFPPFHFAPDNKKRRPVSLRPHGATVSALTGSLSTVSPDEYRQDMVGMHRNANEIARPKSLADPAHLVLHMVDTELSRLTSHY